MWQKREGKIRLGLNWVSFLFSGQTEKAHPEPQRFRVGAFPIWAAGTGKSYSQVSLWTHFLFLMLLDYAEELEDCSQLAKAFSVKSRSNTTSVSGLWSDFQLEVNTQTLANMNLSTPLIKTYCE